MGRREPATTSATGKRKTSNRGFTLLEVLVASVILIVGFSLVAIQINRHISVLEFLRNSLNSYRLADKQMMDAARRRQCSLPVPDQGKEGEFSWQVRLEKLDPPVPGLAAVISEVTWKFRGSDRLTRLTTEFSMPDEEVPK